MFGLGKYLEKIKPYLGMLAILYPYLQKFAVSQGIPLPDLGDLSSYGNLAVQGAGTALLAKSEKIGKKKPSAPYVFNT